MLTERDLVKARRGYPHLYQGQTSRRGTYTPATDTIRLFKKADLSTFAHEAGHRWLFELVDDLGDARLTPAARERTRDANAMAGNVINALQGLTSGLVGMIDLKGPFVRRAALLAARQPLALRDSIMEKSPFMRERMSNKSQKLAVDLKGQFRTYSSLSHRWESAATVEAALHKAGDFFDKHGYILQEVVQNRVDSVIWWGAYEQACADKAPEAEAVARADALVRQSQGSFNPEHSSGWERGNAFVRALLKFCGYFNGLASYLYSRIRVASRTLSKEDFALSLGKTYLYGVLLPAVLSEAFAQAVRDTRDDDLVKMIKEG